MIDIPLLDELRATRRRLAEEVELDLESYAEMLRGVGQTLPGEYVTALFCPGFFAKRQFIERGGMIVQRSGVKSR